MEEAYIAPTTDLEKNLAEIWNKVLGLDKVGVNDNFFTIGGDSLLTVNVVSLVEQKLNLNIPVAKIFQYPTISSLVKHLSHDQKQQPSNEKIQDRSQRRKAALAKRKRTKMDNI
jgi:acyl carrier protein